MYVVKGVPAVRDLKGLSRTVAGWLHAASARGEAVLDQQSDRVLAQIQAGLSVIVFDDDSKPMGFLTGYSLGVDAAGNHWREVGSGIVPRNLRGRGIGNLLYSQISQHFPYDYLIGTTKNVVALKCSLQAGFKIVPFSIVPHEIREGLCYQAPCFVPRSDSSFRCVHEHDFQGTCFARLRYPLA